MDIVCHVAIADDWEAGARFGEYEVATRGVAWEPGDYIRATDPEHVAHVVAGIYGDVRLPLLRVDCSVTGLTAHGIEVARVDGNPRIFGAIPMVPEVVTAVVPIPRDR